MVLSPVSVLVRGWEFSKTIPFELPQEDLFPSTGMAFEGVEKFSKISAIVSTSGWQEVFCYLSLWLVPQQLVQDF